jgi:hypothetical protein
MFETILTNPVAVVGIMVTIMILVIVAYTMVGGGRCPTEIHRNADGSLKLHPTGQTFHDMNAFQQWWHAPGGLQSSCPLPLMTKEREVSVIADRNSHEQTYAKTPINKVDDYELSRIVGYERDGDMVMPRENYNMILEKRAFDWADRPMSSDERRGKYQGLQEGFTASGELKSETREAVARYGERRKTHADEDLECKMSREAREVAAMVGNAYESDPNWEPVVTKVGPHHWEVNELKPRRRYGEIEETVEDRVVDTNNDAVDVQFRFRERPVVEDAIDPYFGGIGNADTALPYSAAKGFGGFSSGEPALTSSATGGFGGLPFASDRYSTDPFMGPVPGMERMFGPTFDHKKWY